MLGLLGCLDGMLNQEKNQISHKQLTPRKKPKFTTITRQTKRRFMIRTQHLNQIKTCLKNLIATITLISYGCAAEVKQVKIAEPVKIAAVAKERDELSGAQEIDPNNPPVDGIWMTWDDAWQLAIQSRQERLNLELKILQSNQERDIFRYKLMNTEKILQDQYSPAKKFWSEWGFVIGMAAGFLGGVGTAIGVQSAINK